MHGYIVIVMTLTRTVIVTIALIAITFDNQTNCTNNHNIKESQIQW